MSSRAWPLRIQDILKAISSIQVVLDGKTFADFEANSLLVKAVLYDFIVIGEAAVSIPEEIRVKAPDIPWRLMANMRNVVAHEYFRVDSEIIWDTSRSNLPKLVEPLQKLLLEGDA